MTIYIVTAGDYSDYHIIGAFTDKAKAEAIQALNEKADIEEYDADQMPDIPVGMTAWQVHIERDGAVNWIFQKDIRPDFAGFDDDEIYGGTYPYGAQRLVCQMWARDKDHAIKIAGERRARWIAENKWPEPG